MRIVPVSISGPRALGGQSADGIVARLTVQRRWTAIAATYLGLGVEHILLGIGYLLFLVAMLLLVRSWHRLVATITAFTVAHSITLARPRLHSRAAEPVDEAIALSIVFVAAEIVRGPAGRPGLTERWPWIVAFVFGLLHGLGSASALREVGLPENATPASLDRRTSGAPSRTTHPNLARRTSPRRHANSG